LTAVALAWRNDDRYSGAWKSTGEYTVMGYPGDPGKAPRMTLTIERKGDGWTVGGINPDFSYPVKEANGQLVRTDDPKLALLELRGDKLYLLGPPAEFEFSRQP